MNIVAGDQSEVIAFLSDPRTYGSDRPVETHETHGSFVFLVGEHAYKLKRAVKYPYMDYSTAELRRRMCERELAVNRRTAPQLYENVIAIVRDGKFLRFGDSDDRNVVDWLVVMRRFDQASVLEQRRKAGTLTREDLLSLAEVIAASHRDAEIVRVRGGAYAMRETVEETVSILNERCANTDLAPLALRYAELSETCLQHTRDVLGWRSQAGFVRRCHGDLHLNNVCLIDGKPVLFDAIEFNEFFSCIDVFYDLAFMLMDLDWHGLRTYSNVLLNRYLERTHDYAGLVALPLFLSCRAAIRAHVAMSTLQNASAGSVDEGTPGRLLQAANAYLQPRKPQLIAVGGVSGTGKSTLSRLLAPAIGAAPGAIVLRSDVVRKSFLGVAETTRLGENAYDKRTNISVYERLFLTAALVLKTGHSVIVDAVFADEAERSRIESAAHAASVEFHGLWLTAPRRVLEERIANRSGDASDATVAVLRKQMESSFEPLHWPVVPASGTPAHVLQHAEWAIGLGAKMAI